MSNEREKENVNHVIKQQRVMSRDMMLQHVPPKT